MTQQTHKEVLSLQSVRLASTRGHVVIVEPGIPTKIPAALFLEASKRGCVDYNPAMIAAFKKAMEDAANAPAAQPTPAKPAVDVAKLAKDAVRQVLAAADAEPELLTASGLPRLPAVRAAYEILCGDQHVDPDLKITTDLINALFLDIQEETKPAPAKDAPRYPNGVPEGDLELEVGGDVEGMLSRVGETEE